MSCGVQLLIASSFFIRCLAFFFNKPLMRSRAYYENPGFTLHHDAHEFDDDSCAILVPRQTSVDRELKNCHSGVSSG